MCAAWSKSLLCAYVFECVRVCARACTFNNAFKCEREKEGGSVCVREGVRESDCVRERVIV